jgi:hypothetical protein
VVGASAKDKAACSVARWHECSRDHLPGLALMILYDILERR